MARRTAHTNSRNLAAALRAGQFLEVASALHVMKYNRNTRVYSNLTVPFKNGATRLDLLVVIGNRFLIAEMKNYKNRLSGELSNYHWVAQTAKRTFYIVNPLRQNMHHSVALSSALTNEGISTKDLHFEDYIVVPDGCILDVPDTVLSHILTKSMWESLIEEYPNDEITPPDIIAVLDKWRGV